MSNPGRTVESEVERLPLENLKRLSREFSEHLNTLDRQNIPDTYQSAIAETTTRARALLGEMETFITHVVSDLELSEKELKKSSKIILGRLSEQLDKVTESTQIAVTSVLNRIDLICERQNTVFEQIIRLREQLSIEAGSCEPTSMIDALTKIESLEGEIQSEAFEIMNEMQFQDITSQQIQLAHYLLEEAKAKLLDFRKLLSVFSNQPLSVAKQPGGKQVFDPGATLKDREDRQHLADEISKKFGQDSGNFGHKHRQCVNPMDYSRRSDAYIKVTPAISSFKGI